MKSHTTICDVCGMEITMNMDERIKRINELYHKSQNEGLTDEEKLEQSILRQEYVDSIKRNMKAQLDNIEIVRPDGSVEKLKPSYKKNKKSNYALIYGMNVETGKKHIYMYDKEEDTLQIYNDELNDVSDEKIEQYKMLLNNIYDICFDQNKRTFYIDWILIDR